MLTRENKIYVQTL